MHEGEVSTSGKTDKGAVRARLTTTGPVKECEFCAVPHPKTWFAPYTLPSGGKGLRHSCFLSLRLGRALTPHEIASEMLAIPARQAETYDTSFCKGPCRNQRGWDWFPYDVDAKRLSPLCWKCLGLIAADAPIMTSPKALKVAAGLRSTNASNPRRRGRLDEAVLPAPPNGDHVRQALASANGGLPQDTRESALHDVLEKLRRLGVAEVRFVVSDNRIAVRWAGQIRVESLDDTV